MTRTGFSKSLDTWALTCGSIWEILGVFAGNVSADSLHQLMKILVIGIGGCKTTGVWYRKQVVTATSSLSQGWQ